ncbi:capsular polysaccharide export protein, LipB/KpsS family [Shewanella halifaxensis]|uniref:capsular polysaccharide export protein, LipB/KpsS family n=1 Tax=Shewanella halifaxensis TaxID=271098 RepID=UPI000D58E1B4|nr:hypothetical protein [Shewanella halifaxensis]
MSKSRSFNMMFNSFFDSRSANVISDSYFLKNYIISDYQLLLRKINFLNELDRLNKKSISKLFNESTKQRTSKYVASLPWNEKKLKGMNCYIKDILGYDYYTSPDDKKFNYESVDDFYVWGEDQRYDEFSNKRLSEKYGSRLIRLEYGFISSKDIALKDSPQHSLIMCPEVMYYDATKVSDMERCLNDDSLVFNEEEITRAKKCISDIVTKGITKYNHAPKISLHDRFELSNKKKILLVDQRYGDKSIEMGLADQSSFERMYSEALKYTDCDIFIKLHPDALTGGKDSALSKVIPKDVPPNVFIIDFDINPYSLLKEIDTVFVCVSQFGFEALLAGKEVHTFGVSFYSHWGVTIDHVNFKRRELKRTIEEIFFVFYIVYSSYYLPKIGRCSVEDVISYFSMDGSMNNNVENSKKNELMVSDNVSNKPVKILIVLPSGRFGASGRYIQELSWYMQKNNAEIMILAEGNEIKTYSGITWLNLEFEGIRLSKKIVEKVNDFSPDFIFENGVRSRAQRAALELVLLTGAKLALQSEDDDIQVYNERHPNPSSECISVLDKEELSASDLACFIKSNDWNYTLSVLADPNYDRWVEPVLRSICYQMSVFNTAIWYPFERRLKDEYAKPTFVLPPVTDGDKLAKLSLSKQEKDIFLKQYKLSSEKIIFFLGGTIYDYSEEYFLFIKALNFLSDISSEKIQFITVSGRSNINVAKVTKDMLNNEIEYLDMGSPNDDDYLNMLLACDIVCSPGIPDRFNQYRLPSRLVKAMFLSKAVLTSKCGFGESLKHGYNGIIIDGNQPYDWAISINECLNRKSINSIGTNGLFFAKEHFDVKKVAKELVYKFQSLR